MLIVICLDLEDGLDPITGLVGRIALAGADVELLHVVDTVERVILERSLHAGVVRPQLADVEEELDDDERAMLRATYDQAAPVLGAQGIANIRLSVGSGRPERVIVSHLSEANADLCVVARRTDWKQRREVGPHSVGKVARYIVDHASCPVFVLR
ncbi:MAG TPA: universal stress protein [Candidatus Eremiobacteraceae bacterium]|jgi:nucleotide-binding universal stress UspA family protein